ncbi:MAG: transposase [candidate division WOR-3 bacterium]
MCIYDAASKAEAVIWIVYFADHYRLHPPAVKCLLENQDDLLSYFDFPKEHWRHLKTNDPVESAFAPVRSRVKRLIRYWSAFGLIYRPLTEQETRWFRLTPPYLFAAVITGGQVP